MILTCPSCGTRYQTDTAHFAPQGRNVRCAKCGHVWFQAPLETETEPEPEPQIIADSPDTHGEGAPQPGRESHAESPTAPRSRVGVVLGWLALLALAAGAAWAFISYRQAIAELWPQSASFFAAIDRPVNLLGLAFADIAVDREFEAGQNVLAISGNVVNVTARELAVPDIRVVLTDSARRELYRWDFAPGAATLAPGAAAQFLTRLSGPPPEAEVAAVEFALPGAAP